jgi:hypothetical protein
MAQERLLSPKELSQAVGISVTQIRVLMNEGRLEYLAISPKTRLLTMSGWEKFRQTATRSGDHSVSHTGGQTDGHADMQTGIHANGQTGNFADVQTGKQ